MSVPYNLSVFDLMQIPRFKEASKLNDTKIIEEVLWENGLDVKQAYVTNHCLHRTLSSKIPFEGIRFEGQERLDRLWIKSGAASLDAIIHSSRDESLVEELRSLNPRAAKEWDDERECGVDLELISGGVMD